jgi:hypothetical protein
VSVLDTLVDHAYIFFYAVALIARGVMPAFPHATTVLEAVANTSLSLGFLATNPSAALAALTGRTPQVKTVTVPVTP